MVQRVKDLVDRDLFAAMILQGIVIHEGIGNMAKAAETAVAQAEALIVELRRIRETISRRSPLWTTMNSEQRGSPARIFARHP